MRDLILFGALLVGALSASALLTAGSALAQAPVPAAQPAPAAPPPAGTPNGCIPVDGLTFELMGPELMLARRGENSVAMIRTHMFLPAGLSSMRFIAGEICARGAKRSVQINGYVYEIADIRPIDGDTRRRSAQVESSGQSATVIP